MTVVPSTILTTIATPSRLQVSRRPTPETSRGSRIPVRVAPHRSQGGRLEYTLPSNMKAAFAAQQQASATATAVIQNQLQQAEQANNNLIATLQVQAVPVVGAGAGGAGVGGVGGGGPVRIDNSLVDSIPKFLGITEELATEFIDRIEALAATEGWTAQQQVLVAVRRLGGAALEWHAQVGLGGLVSSVQSGVSINSPFK
uniref:Uncharacterized protein n=1 Tax=Daphnia galeata TaxID=27404 RepID=A0A8J2R8Q7_9CRUS|nr:unnamed protein product [Daphnia galeata]